MIMTLAHDKLMEMISEGNRIVLARTGAAAETMFEKVAKPDASEDDATMSILYRYGSAAIRAYGQVFADAAQTYCAALSFDVRSGDWQMDDDMVSGGQVLAHKGDPMVMSAILMSDVDLPEQDQLTPVTLIRTYIVDVPDRRNEMPDIRSLINKRRAAYHQAFANKPLDLEAQRAIISSIYMETAYLYPTVMKPTPRYFEPHQSYQDPNLGKTTTIGYMHRHDNKLSVATSVTLNHEFIERLATKITAMRRGH
jgi:hypothetical protein